VAIEYILLDKNDLRENVEVSDAELKAQYDQFLASYQAEEQRAVAHILVEVTAEQDDEAALKKIMAVQARIRAGEAFDALAKSESDDLGSAAAGGDLGLNGKGVFSAPFEESMFALAVNEVSEPVRTEFGYHLIKVTGISDKELPDFAEMKYKLTDDILDQKVEAVYVERLELMADITFSAGDLIEPAEVMGLVIQESEPFDRAGGAIDITRNAKVVAAAFSNDLIRERINSTPIELDKERTVVVRVKTHFEPRVQAFDEVAAMLKQELIEQLAGDELKTKAQQAVSDLISGKAMTEVAAGAEVMQHFAVSRASGDLPESVRTLAFSLAKPEAGRIVASTTELDDGSVAVVLLNKVNLPEVALTDDEKKSMAIFLGTRFGQQEYQSLLTQLKNAAEIEKK
uniref:peptidylprolyl isomerase n=1 Tax=Neptunomonas sp. TaxID=1971898 RepID=UPI003567A151